MDYLNYLKSCRTLGEKYPFITVDNIGKSVMGKDILSLTLGVAREYVVIFGGAYGADFFTSHALLSFFSSLCNALAEDGVIAGFRARRALLGRALVIVPALNPDGCEIACKGKSACGNLADKIAKYSGGNYKTFSLNARGKNIDLDFMSVGEPETAAAVSLLEKTSVRHALLLSLGENKLVTPQNSAQSDRLTRMSDIISASTSFALSGDDDLSAGFVDRVFKESGKPTFKVMADPKNQDDLNELLMLFTVM